MELDLLYRFLLGNNSFSLQDHVVVNVEGSDALEYLQRQLTSDISKLSNSSHLSCRLDRGGRIQSFFYVTQQDSQTFILVNEDLLERTLTELQKFVIMEDVTFVKTDKVANISTRRTNNSLTIELLDYTLFLSIDESEVANTITPRELNCFYTLLSWQTYRLNVFCNELVNETRLNELAVSYNKGCFLGQETAAKIESRRGASKYPVLITSTSKLPGEFTYQGKKFEVLSSFENNGHYSSVKVARQFLLNGSNIALDDNDLSVYTYNSLKITTEELSDHFFHEAVNKFHTKEIDSALNLLDELIEFNPYYADAYETKGVILGNSTKYSEAIKVMDELLTVDQDSVMAHTNKSLYLMKLGKIEEAEEEKSLATLASFKKFGDEAKEKKLKEELIIKEQKERERRLSMFKKVLEIDELDTVANFGIADILFHDNDLDSAQIHVRKVLDQDNKYSVAYLLLSKILFEKREYEKCLDLIEKGIVIATAQGELMPANEMQVIKTKIDNMSL